MATEQLTFNRNLFEIDNARNLTPSEVAATFVPISSYWRLLSAKNHILLGSRGSGKTVIAKMLSHNHLALLDDERAGQCVTDRSIIGMYVPTRLKWVGGLKNKPWQTADQKDEFFQWRLNIASCLAFLNSIDSCLACYVSDLGDRAVLERRISSDLWRSWSNVDGHATTLIDIKRYIEDIEWQKQQQLARLRVHGALGVGEQPVGMVFDTELFEPLRRGVQIASRALDLSPRCAWLLCLDEAELLDPDHIKVINSHIRSYSENLFFKITSQPYCYNMLESTLGAAASPGHDFEYIYLDNDPAFFAHTPTEKHRIGTSFARELFAKRSRLSAASVRADELDDLLGTSELLDPQPEQWHRNSKYMHMLDRYASDKTRRRAEELLGTDAFLPEISRKMRGALILRDKVAKLKGAAKLDAYAGTTMAVRCADCNARRLVRIFNALILASAGSGRPRPLPPGVQTDVLMRISDQTLSAARSEPQCGDRLHAFLEMLGNYMHRCLHDEPLGTDQVASVVIGPTVSDDDWQLVEKAVSLGLMYPQIGRTDGDTLPQRRGTFRLSFTLAPHFRLLPRKGHARQLRTIQEWCRHRGAPTGAVVADGQSLQLRLFNDAEDDE